MVKHIILWDLKNDLSDEEKEQWAVKIKEGLENLKNKIEGIVQIEVHINPLESSSAEIILDSTFESEQALKNYTVNPEHMKVALEIVRPNTCNRKCMDYEI